MASRLVAEPRERALEPAVPLEQMLSYAETWIQDLVTGVAFDETGVSLSQEVLRIRAAYVANSNSHVDQCDFLKDSHIREETLRSSKNLEQLCFLDICRRLY